MLLLFTSLPSLSSIDLPPKPPPNKNGHAAPLLAVVITMDVWEATKLVFDRVYTLDPANASKIMGHLLIQENSEKELIRLAFGPDHLLHSFITTARANLATKLVSLPSPMHDPLLTGLHYRIQALCREPSTLGKEAHPLGKGFAESRLSANLTRQRFSRRSHLCRELSSEITAKGLPCVQEVFAESIYTLGKEPGPNVGETALRRLCGARSWPLGKALNICRESCAPLSAKNSRRGASAQGFCREPWPGLSAKNGIFAESLGRGSRQKMASLPRAWLNPLGKPLG
nr:unnamed protein product [Digitaria exilis]